MRDKCWQGQLGYLCSHSISTALECQAGFLSLSLCNGTLAKTVLTQEELVALNHSCNMIHLPIAEHCLFERLAKEFYMEMFTTKYCSFNAAFHLSLRTDIC